MKRKFAEIYRKNVVVQNYILDEYRKKFCELRSENLENFQEIKKKCKDVMWLAQVMEFSCDVEKTLKDLCKKG